ncbi:reticulon-4 receptor-like 2a [Erpetoichthys calabaricus]|uniref:Reticulon 4 receptor-like 2 a n=1 Tax=Erpetoichthys calabaricus TaxID=27687 RepID=A0A8C4X914_ERPCA|nr:reticulon-4 receptor-like 2a [Erpetoichthys calabaricus]
MDTRSSARRRSGFPTFRGSLVFWLILWMIFSKPCSVSSCPRLCICYPAPMTVSCQSQNFSNVPAGIPYDSQRVFLQNNRITELRAESFGFGTQVLWLYSNNITFIEPGAFSDLRDLEELDIGDNRNLRSLNPDIFRGLDKLQSLHMYRCQLGSLPGTIFQKLYSLQFLYLQDNNLHYLQDDLFADLVNLTHLFLHGNRIRVLSENVFRGLVNLDRLLLHENRIRQVSRKAFRDLGRLTILFLFNNTLSELPGPALNDLPSLQFLRLNGNPWSCGCEARPLWEWFRKVRVSSSELVCSTPEDKKGLDLRFLREIDFAPCPLPDLGLGKTTSTFSTKTRWWFPKSLNGNEQLKGIHGSKKKGSISSWDEAKPQPSSFYNKSPKIYSPKDAEESLPKIDTEEYWANYENEDATIRCFEEDCQNEGSFRNTGVRTGVPDLYKLALSLTVVMFFGRL